MRVSVHLLRSYGRFLGQAGRLSYGRLAAGNGREEGDCVAIAEDRGGDLGNGNGGVVEDDEEAGLGMAGGSEKVREGTLPDAGGQVGEEDGERG